MTIVQPLRQEPEVEAGPEAKVFVRSVTAPPGAPWDQLRAARLEAEHGAPIASADLVTRLRRLDGWRPGRPGRFAAMYVMARDIPNVLETDVEIDGQVLRETFRSPSAEAGRRRGLVTAAAAAGVSGLMLAMALGAAVAERLSLAARAERLETRAEADLRSARGEKRLRDAQAALASRNDGSRPMSALLEDLAWAAAAKNPDAHLARLHWERGLMAVEVRGAHAPFQPDPQRVMERSPTPEADGVTLWGVMRRAPAEVAAKPFAAEPRDGAEGRGG